MSEAVRVDCACGAVFDAAPGLAGGITNCPSCGKAVEVPGLRDPFWRVLQVLALVVLVAATAIAYLAGGLAPAGITAAVMAGILLLVSRAL